MSRPIENGAFPSRLKPGVPCAIFYGETEATTWYKVVTWDKLAESCNKYLTKGQLVYCEGRVQVEAWKDKVSEEAKASLVLVAKTVQFGPSSSSLAGEEPGELPF